MSADPVTLSQGQGHWKWYTVVDTNSVYKHGQFSSSSLAIESRETWAVWKKLMAIVRIFATQDAQMNGETNEQLWNPFSYMDHLQKISWGREEDDSVVGVNVSIDLSF